MMQHYCDYDNLLHQLVQCLKYAPVLFLYMYLPAFKLLTTAEYTSSADTAKKKDKLFYYYNNVLSDNTINY